MAETTIPAATSAFQYTPPPETPPDEQADFNQSLKDIVGEIEKEWAPEPEVDPETPAEEPAKPEVETPADPEVAPEVSRGMDRLVQREVALQARESALLAKQSQVDSLQAELTQLRAAVPSKDLQEKLAYSPSEVFKAMGHDPETVVRLAIAEQLKAKGEAVPPALQEFVKNAETTRRIKALESQIAAQNLAQANAAEFNAVRVGAGEYVKKFDGPALKDMPILAKSVKSHPERVQSEILEEIVKDARVRAKTEPDGAPMTYEQAARNVEARWSELKAILMSDVPVSIPGTTQAQAGKPAVPPQPKPPAKPLAPWMQRTQNVESQGIDEAIREFNKLEAARRAK